MTRSRVGELIELTLKPLRSTRRPSHLAAPDRHIGSAIPAQIMRALLAPVISARLATCAFGRLGLVSTELPDTLWLIELISGAGAEPIVVGGWGVDALAASQTRQHRDLDVLVPNEVVGPVVHELLSAGFTVMTDWLPVRVELSDVDNDRHVDIHPIFDDGHGGWWQHATNDTRFEYPSTALTAGVIGSTVVRCVTSAKQRALRSGFEHRAQDVHDLSVLDGLD